MQLVTVKTFDSYFLANIILGRLQSEGVECYLKDETTVTMDPILTNAIGGIKIVVKKENEVAVIEILKRYEEEYLNAATCPKCGAHQFSYIAKPGVTNFLTAIATTLFSNYALAANYVYQCGNCGYETERLPGYSDEESNEEMN
jgi:DNA-directed RNA polymerase subunit M/transcription elongation factor TFIIS